MDFIDTVIWFVIENKVIKDPIVFLTYDGSINLALLWLRMGYAELGKADQSQFSRVIPGSVCKQLHISFPI